MAKMLIKFIILLLVKISVADKDTIPVFLIDYERVMGYLVVDPNPFSKMTTAYFADIILDCIKRSDVVVIFVEDSFCVEDVSAKDVLGSPYNNLHTGLKENYVKYFPSVIEPYELLKQILKPQTINTFYLNSGEKIHDVFDGSFKYLYVYFEDVLNETRIQTLRRHDVIMKEVAQVVHQKAQGAVVAFYTGKKNPVEKIEYVTIAPQEVPKERSVLVESASALYKFIGISVETALRTSKFIQTPTIADERWTSNERLTTILAYTNDFQLKFNFSFRSDGWLLDEVGLVEGGEEVGRTEMGVGAPWNWAYYCGEPLQVTNRRDGSTVSIAEYQIQPFYSHSYFLKKRALDTPANASANLGIIFREGEEEDEPAPTEAAPTEAAPTEAAPTEAAPTEASPDGSSTDEASSTDAAAASNKNTTTGKQFGQTVNCGPFFNARILSGLFVCAICFGIMAFGIILLFDCNANNSYDDPHGKPLVIGTEQH